MKIIYFVMICASLGKCYAQGTEDTLFLIDRVCNKLKIAYVLDSGRLTFYDVNDSFLFIADNEGQYNLFDIANNKWKKGRVKPKKHLRLAGSKFSEFRGNTPHVGNFKSTGFSEFHIDESINYHMGSYTGNISTMKYLPEFNSVVLHLNIYEKPRQDRLYLVPCYSVKNLKDNYIGVKELVNTPKFLYVSEKISNIIVDNKSASIAFLSSDTLLIHLDLKNTETRTVYHDLGNDYTIGFYNKDSIVVVEKNGIVSILSLITHSINRVSSEFDLSDKSDFFVSGKYLYCIKYEILYVIEIDPNGLLFREEYIFGSNIISYKVSHDGLKIIVHTVYNTL